MSLSVTSPDTTPGAMRVQAHIFANIPPNKRLELALAMSDSLRQVVAAVVRSRHPEYSSEQIKLAVIRLTLGDELFRKAYPGVEIDT
jgi:hypothetical protein